MNHPTPEQRYEGIMRRAVKEAKMSFTWAAPPSLYPLVFSLQARDVVQM